MNVDLIIQAWTVSKSDVMPNWYVAGEGLQPRLIKSTADGNKDFVGEFISPQQYKRYDYDVYEPFTALQRYNRFAFFLFRCIQILMV